LHEHLIDNEIAGRDITISLAMDSLNEIPNASFEFGGGTPDDWTLGIAGGTGSTWSRSSTYADHRTWSLKITNPSSGLSSPAVRSSTFKVNATGRDLIVRYRAKLLSAGIDSGIAISLGGLWWDAGLGAWGIGRALNLFSHAGTSFETVELTIPLSSFAQDGAELDCFVDLQNEDLNDAAKQIFYDSVQMEAVPRGAGSSKIADFHVNRADLESADVFTVYRGEVRRYPWKRGRVKIVTQNILGRRHTDIPTALVSTKWGRNWDIDPETEGKPFPMTYGDLSFRPYGDDPGAASPVVDRVDIGEDKEVVPRQLSTSLAQCVLVNSRNNSRQVPTDVTLYVDRPGMKVNELGFLHHYNAEANRYFRELLIDNFSSPADSEWTKLPDESRIYADNDNVDVRYADQGQIALSIYQRFTKHTGNQPAGGGYFGAWTNFWRLGQGNYSGRARAELSGGAAGSLQKFRFAVDVFKIHDVELIAAYALARATITGGYSPGDAYIDIRITDGTVSQTIRLVDGGGVLNNSPFTADDSTAPTHGETQFPFNMGNDTIRRFDWWNTPTDRSMATGFGREIISKTQADDTVYLYDLALRLDLTININDFVPFISCKGREYLDTWGSRKTAGNLIENPVDVLEGVLRDELGVVAADIRTALFDTANTARSAWKCAGQLVDSTRSEDVIDEMAENAALAYWIDTDGQESVRALGYSATPDKTIRTRDVKLGSIELDYTSRDEIINDFTVNYGYNPAAEEYMAQAWANRHGSTIEDMIYTDKLIESWKSIGKKENRREFFARWIQDSATAEELLKFLIDWQRLRRRTIQLELWLDSIGVELGDLVKFDGFADLIPDASDLVMVVDKLRLDKKRGVIKASLLEVIDGTVVDARRAWVTADELTVHYDEVVDVLLIYTARPTADVTTGWDTAEPAGDHYSTVDDDPLAPDDGDYIYTETMDDTDEYEVTDAPAALDDVTQIDRTIRAQIIDPAGTARLELRLFHSSGTPVTGNPKYVNGADLGGYGVLGNATVSWTSLSLTKAQMDTVQMRTKILAS
jgi:hypothetical protein